MRPFIFLFLFSLFSLSAWANNRVVIYDGPGSCRGCAAGMRSILEKSGYQVRIITPRELTPATLAQADLYIQPGGKNTMHVRDSVGEKGLAAIKDFVKKGGKYYGACLGGTLGSTGPDDRGEMLGMLPVRAHESGNRQAKIVDIDVSFGNFGRRKVFIQDPPEFYLLEGAQSKVKVIASYDDGRIAGVRGRYGQGDVVLLGPHFEADGWAERAGIKDADGKDHKVFIWIIDDLLKSKKPAITTPGSKKSAR